MTTSEGSSLKGEHIEHPLLHYQQRYNWDCGVASVLMLLDPRQRTHLLDNFDAVCQQEGFYKSTWTIDLCYLLKRYNIEHIMHTTMPGVNEGYKNYSYYKKIIDMDRSRVARRFAEAPSSGLRIRPSALTEEALRAHMSQGPAILLVDGPLLVCRQCKHNKMRHEIRRMFGGSYRGHYIVVTGYKDHHWLYRDPAVSDRVCETTGPRLFAAYSASGTDRDAILVYRDYRTHTTHSQMNTDDT